MIEVKNITKEFTSEAGNVVHAVDNVSFTAHDGEIFGIIGLSGAGKSTLIRCINRLEEPSGGEIFIDGRDILKLDEEELLKERKNIGMIFQSFNLFMQKTVYENIAYPLVINGRSKEEIDSRVNELLDFIDLRDKRDNYPAELSGGQKQRVAIARAIALNPKILLSDEGTSALDPANAAQVLSLLRKVVSKYQTTIIMITHQMEVAKEVCDRIAVMEHGRIVEEQRTEDLFKNPQSKVTQNFIKNVDHVEEYDQILQDDFEGDVYRLSYDRNADQPILTQCIRKFDVTLNIVSGDINRVGGSNIGYLVVEITGEREEEERAIAFLKENGVSVEAVL